MATAGWFLGAFSFSAFRSPKGGAKLCARLRRCCSRGLPSLRGNFGRFPFHNSLRHAGRRFTCRMKWEREISFTLETQYL